jgi:hypothetical protein
VRGFGDSRWQGYYYYYYFIFGFFEEAKLAMIIHAHEDLAKF